MVTATELESFCSSVHALRYSHEPVGLKSPDCVTIFNQHCEDPRKFCEEIEKLVADATSASDIPPATPLTWDFRNNSG